MLCLVLFLYEKKIAIVVSFVIGFIDWKIHNQCLWLLFLGVLWTYRTLMEGSGCSNVFRKIQWISINRLRKIVSHFSLFFLCLFLNVWYKILVILINTQCSSIGKSSVLNLHNYTTIIIFYEKLFLVLNSVRFRCLSFPFFTQNGQTECTGRLM